MRSSPRLHVWSCAALASTILIAGLTAVQAPAVLASQVQSARHLPPLPQQNPLVRKSKPQRILEPMRHQQPRMRPSSWLGQNDEHATLLAIHTALSSVGDGGAYVWRRGNGLLDGLIRPTTSFKDKAGNVCRHVVIRLNSRRYSREIEGIACRDAAGAWTLSG